jgi:parallel beta-helix repeat protein
MIRKRQMSNTTVLSALTLSALLLCLPAAPARGAIYYVSTDGNDTNTGTSPKLAWRTITHAAKMAKAGDLVRIKGGDYGHERVVVKNSGTADAPIRFEGYGGEVLLDGMTKELKDKIKRKEKIGLTSHGVDIRGKSYIRLSGITVRVYGMGIIVKNSHHVIVEKCTTGISGFGGISIGGSEYCEVKGCTAYNANQAIAVSGGSHNLLEDCWSYRNPDLPKGVHYCYAAGNTKHLTVRGCRGERAGHGICFVPGSRCCTVTDCEMRNCWEHFGVRQGGRDITFVNCYAETKGGPSTHGFYYRTGAHNITVKNCRVKNMTHGLHVELTNDKRWGVARNVTFENCIATHCLYGIRIEGPNTKVLNCVSARNKYGVEICGPRKWLEGKTSAAEGLAIKGCIITGNDVGIQSPFPTAKAITNCNVWGNKTKLAGKASLGAGCISKDPLFVNPDKNDWHFKKTSSCKDMGPYADDPKASIGRK